MVEFGPYSIYVMPPVSLSFAKEEETVGEDCTIVKGVLGVGHYDIHAPFYCKGSFHMFNHENSAGKVCIRMLGQEVCADPGKVAKIADYTLMTYSDTIEVEVRAYGVGKDIVTIVYDYDLEDPSGNAYYRETKDNITVEIPRGAVATKRVKGRLTISVGFPTSYRVRLIYESGPSDSKLYVELPFIGSREIGVGESASFEVSVERWFESDVILRFSKPTGPMFPAVVKIVVE